MKNREAIPDVKSCDKLDNKEKLNIKETAKGEVLNKRQKFNEYGPIIKTVVIVELVFVLIFTVFLANCLVPSGSMEPTILSQTRVFADRTAYWCKNPQRLDIIAFKNPDQETIVYCKRIIGMPGETLNIKNGIAYIDDQPLEEEYVVNNFTGDYGPFYIPKKGDEIQYNTDTQTAFYKEYPVGNYNFITKYCENKDGEYIVKDDCYFCMGDNRDNSVDARFWKNKYITKKSIVGKMFLNLNKIEKIY